MKTPLLISLASLAVLFLVTARSAKAQPLDPPRLGFRGTLVAVDPREIPAPDEFANQGMRVDSVTRGTPAARLGLERGDVIISVDSMRFTTQAGYLHALRCAGQQPSLIIRNVRTGELIRRSVSLPHQLPPDDEAGPQPPDTYLMSIDLAADMNPRR
jgi:S1-C subfamily serine protease